MADQKILSANVIRLRKENGMSQRELARLSLLDLKTIIGIEKQRKNPTLYTLGRIAEAFSCATFVLLMDSETQGK